MYRRRVAKSPGKVRKLPKTKCCVVQAACEPLPAAHAQGGHAARRVYGQEAQAGPVDGKKVTKKPGRLSAA